MPTLIIETGLTRWRAGTTPLRGGGSDCSVDGQHVGSHDVFTYRPIRRPVAVGEHRLDVHQTGTRSGHTVTARLSVVGRTGSSGSSCGRARRGGCGSRRPT